MAINLSPNMNLPIPGVGTEPGPDYATDVNNSLTIVDQHDHTPGSGVQLTAESINLTSSLPLNNNSLTLTKSIDFQIQSANSALSSLYSQGVDLWFNNAAGTPIQLTANGAVAGTPGAISNLVSPASAAYVLATQTFVFSSDVNTPANIDGASFLIRNLSAGSKALTLAPPNAMGADYTLTLPVLPAQTNVMTLATSGAMASITYDQVAANMTSTGANAIFADITSTPFGVCDLIGLNMSGIGSDAIGTKIGAAGAQNIANNMPAAGADVIAASMTSTGANTIAGSMTALGANSIGTIMSPTGANAVANTRTRSVGSSVGAGGVALSASSGAFSSVAPASGLVTNLSVTLTTTGRPIRILLVPDGTTNSLDVRGLTNIGNINAQLVYRRDATAIGSILIAANSTGGNITATAPSLEVLDTPGVGTYTYTVRCDTTAATMQVANAKLLAYEL